MAMINWENSEERAIERARKEGKLIMFDLSAAPK